MASICAICHEELEQSTRIVTKCNHEFHKACIQQWNNLKEDCPMCRKEVTPISIIDGVENKADYILKQFRVWLDEIKSEFETFEDRCAAITEMFEKIPAIGALLIEHLRTRQ